MRRGKYKYRFMKIQDNNCQVDVQLCDVANRIVGAFAFDKRVVLCITDFDGIVDCCTGAWVTGEVPAGRHRLNAPTVKHGIQRRHCASGHGQLVTKPKTNNDQNLSFIFST